MKILVSVEKTLHYGHWWDKLLGGAKASEKVLSDPRKRKL